MKHIKLFEQFVNEASAPKPAQDLAKAFRGTVSPDHDADGLWNIDFPKNEYLQISYATTDEFGPEGFQIGDDNGDEIYIGKDLKAAIKAIKSFKK